MSGPIRCSKCGDVIGVRGETEKAITLMRMMRGQPFPEFSVPKLRCPGIGRHVPPVVKREPRFFGWLALATRFYPETRTQSQWFEYQGPWDRLALWLAIHLGARVTKLLPVYSLLGNAGLDRRSVAEGVMVSGEWVWPDGWFGLIGEGLKKLNAQAS